MSGTELDRLAVEMFQTFARFEYALKASGFNAGNGDAKADWTAFARSIPGVFDDPRDSAVKMAVGYILAHPPKKQVVEQGVLEWKDAGAGTSLRSDEVLIYVRRVRNNLFHGGKFNGRWFEPQRSAELLQHSLVILKACLEASPQVRSAYDG
jgi:hypothetical protein